MASSMRVLGALCVAAALVLSTGGVAYRIKADPQPEASPVVPVATASSDAPIAGTEQVPDPGTCPAPVSPKPVVIHLKRQPSSKAFISLSNSGYNYSDPLRVPTAAPRRPSREPAPADPARLESPAPARAQDGE